MPSLQLPPKRPGEQPVTISNARSIVVVGANGAGKTRFGAHVEQAAGAKAHRISAQRSLDIPVNFQPRPYQAAESTLLYGTYQANWDDTQHLTYKANHRWGNDPAVHMLTDYESLMAFLFADETKRSRNYARAALGTIPTRPSPKCKLDTLSAIWAAVMPQRTLIVGDDRVQAKVSTSTPYEVRQMSDGERVAFYLIGQALCAPTDGIIIIDEPEIHLHRAILAPLWDQIEAARPDCLFVYITHDLDFAATRIGAHRIWLRSFDGKKWDWEEIDASSPLPDALTMQVLGNRRPILFVEGDGTSHDTAVYTALYPEKYVVPRQSCAKVAEATKAMGALPMFHHLSVQGLVDRDRRSDDEIAALKTSGVLVADVAEIENLLCIPEALGAVAAQLKIPDPQNAVDGVKAGVLAELEKQRDQQALNRALAEIQFRLNGFGPKIGKFDAATLQNELKTYLTGIDLNEAVAKAKTIFDDVLTRKDYLAALRFLNWKGIVAFVARALGVTPGVYTGLVLGKLKEEPAGGVAQAMRKLIGA